MFEGHDTTASAMSFILYSLACHPEYQKMCRDEVLQALDGKDVMEWWAYIWKQCKCMSVLPIVELTLVCLLFREDLSKIPYTTMFIKESLRLYPPVPGMSRITTKTITFFDGRTLPAGLSLMVLCRWMWIKQHTVACIKRLYPVVKDKVKVYGTAGRSPEQIKYIVSYED